MSSTTNSLFASVVLAAAGATGLAYTLAHPGVVANFAGRLFDGTETIQRDEAVETAEPVSERQDVPATGGVVSLPAGAYGHFETEADVNGRPVDVMVDTGASLVALTYDDAERLGIYVNPRDFTHVAKTANGTARVAPVTISRISIGGITVRDVPAVVSERGKSERSLLGMSFLGRLSRVEMRGGTLVLQE
jgi:aspartyl protease family protein